MKSRQLYSIKYRGVPVIVTATSEVSDAASREAAKLLRVKPTIPEVLSKEVPLYSKSITGSRSALRNAVKKTHTEYRMDILFQKPRHFKFLNMLAEKAYVDKIRGPIVERIPYNQVNDFKYFREYALNAIKSRQRRIAKLREFSRRMNNPGTDFIHRGISYTTTIDVPSQWVIQTTVKESNGYNNRRHHIYIEPNAILKLAEARKSKQVFLPKKPTTSERHVSVEIEFAIKLNMQELGTKLFDAGVAAYVHLKTDGSVRDFGEGYNPFEISVCMPVSKRDEVLRATLGVLNQHGAKVNRTCGLHVHLDMRGYDHRKAFSNLVSAQPILYQMVPASRRTNTYCAKTTNKNYDHYLRTSNRYLGINPQSYRKYGTIEVRLHSGTTDFVKITNFVDILTAVGYNDKEIVRGASTVSGFVKQHKLPKHIESYIMQRIVLFGVSSQEEAA